VLGTVRGGPPFDGEEALLRRHALRLALGWVACTSCHERRELTDQVGGLHRRADGVRCGVWLMVVLVALLAAAGCMTPAPAYASYARSSSMRRRSRGIARTRAPEQLVVPGCPPPAPKQAAWVENRRDRLKVMSVRWRGGEWSRLQDVAHILSLQQRNAYDAARARGDYQRRPKDLTPSDVVRLATLAEMDRVVAAAAAAAAGPKAKRYSARKAVKS
jgi:hypothetical protein